MSELAIDVRDVTKRYGRKVQALKGVSLSVNRGEVFGLLGPNGAGKSTLIKILMTVVRPTTVAGTMLGMPIGHKPTLARVGYLPEQHRFPKYLTGRQTIEFFAALSGRTRHERQTKAAELVEIVGMKDWADQRVDRYSKGMMQRIGLAQAMAADPDLILLDEPTDGVDPIGRKDIRNILSELGRQGKTVFVNSHLLSELEMVCQRVAIIVGGLVARQGSVSDLTRDQAGYEIESAVLPLTGMAAAIKSILTPGADQTTTGVPVRITGPVVRCDSTDPTAVQLVIDAMRSAGLPIKRVQAVRPSLEDLFVEAVGGPAGGTVQVGARTNAFPVQPIPRV